MWNNIKKMFGFGKSEAPAAAPEVATAPYKVEAPTVVGNTVITPVTPEPTPPQPVATATFDSASSKSEVEVVAAPKKKSTPKKSNKAFMYPKSADDAPAQPAKKPRASGKPKQKKTT